MKRLAIFCLFQLFSFLAFQLFAANPTVLYNTVDFTGAPLTNAAVTITPIRNVHSQSNQVILGIPRTNVTDYLGSCAYTNVVPADYAVEIETPDRTIKFTNCIPDTSGTIYADAWICGARATNGVAYSSTQSDSLFVKKTNSQAYGLSVSNLTVTSSNTPAPSPGMALVLNGSGSLSYSNVAGEVTTAQLLNASNVSVTITITASNAILSFLQATNAALIASIATSDNALSNALRTQFFAADLTTSNGLVSFVMTLSNTLATALNTKMETNNGASFNQTAHTITLAGTVTLTNGTAIFSDNLTSNLLFKALCLAFTNAGVKVGIGTNAPIAGMHLAGLTNAFQITVPSNSAAPPFLIDFAESQSGGKKQAFILASTGAAPQIMQFGMDDRVGYGVRFIANVSGIGQEAGIQNSAGQGIFAGNTASVGLSPVLKLGGSANLGPSAFNGNMHVSAPSAGTLIITNGTPGGSTLVGIGTNAPESTLHVHGLLTTRGTNFAEVLAVGNSIDSQIKSNSTGVLVLGNGRFYLDGSGHSHKAAGRNFHFGGDGAAPTLVDSGTNLNLTGSFTLNGLVGIGTATPNAQLQTTGSVNLATSGGTLGIFADLTNSPNITYVLARTNSLLSVSNSTTETTIATYTIKPSEIGTNRTIVLDIMGDILNNNAGGACTLRIYFGTTTVFDAATASLAASANRRPLYIRAQIMNLDSTASQYMEADVRIGSTTSPTSGMGAIAGAMSANVTVSGVATEDTTSAKEFRVTIANPLTGVFTVDRRAFKVIRQ